MTTEGDAGVVNVIRIERRNKLRGTEVVFEHVRFVMTETLL